MTALSKWESYLSNHPKLKKILQNC